MIRGAAAWPGVRIAASPDQADAGFFFEDATTSPTQRLQHGRSYNFGCTDISKTPVAAVFASVFGYPLVLDPLTATGPAVEKGEVNGAHDGRIVQCPMPPLPGKTYQRLMDKVGEDGCARDRRTHCIGGTPVTVWVKRRAADRRLLPPNPVGHDAFPGRRILGLRGRVDRTLRGRDAARLGRTRHYARSGG